MCTHNIWDLRWVIRILEFKIENDGNSYKSYNVWKVKSIAKYYKIKKYSTDFNDSRNA
jgi:hypothetical protein